MFRRVLDPYLEMIVVGYSDIEIDSPVLGLDRPMHLNRVDLSGVHQELPMAEIVDTLLRVVVHVLSHAVEMRPVEQHALQVWASRVPARLQKDEMEKKKKRKQVE